MKWLCKIGFHKWIIKNNYKDKDFFVYPLKRRCKKCRKLQKFYAPSQMWDIIKQNT